MAETIQDIEERLLGRDGVLPTDRDTFQATSTGDWPSIAGSPNFREAHKRRAVTNPGELIHRPDYGGGLTLNVSALDTDTQRALIRNSIRNNALRDPRTGEVVVRVSEDGVVAGRIFVDLEITPFRNVELTEQTGFVIEV